MCPRSADPAAIHVEDGARNHDKGQEGGGGGPCSADPAASHAMEPGFMVGGGQWVQSEQTQQTQQ